MQWTNILCSASIAQPISNAINVYINAQMIVLMINVNINAIFLELLSIMLIVITSLHREVWS